MSVRLSRAEARRLGIDVTEDTRPKGPVSARLSTPTSLEGVARAERNGTPAFLLRLMTYNMPRCRLGPEDREAKAFSDQLRVWTLEGKLKAIWWHTASELAGGGGRAAQIRYAIAKALGLIPGSPDYIFLHAEKGGFALEMKARKGGALTPSQKDFRDWCALRDIPYVKVHGCEAAIRQLHEWGLVDGEAPSGTTSEENSS